MISQAIATRGHHVRRKEVPCVGPGRPCISLLESGETWARFEVSPPSDIDYAGTLIQYNPVGTCSKYIEHGPEIGGIIEVAGINDPGIYSFVPWAYDGTGCLSKPGDPVIASFPVNTISMPQFVLDNCAWRTIWDIIRGKPDSISLQSVMRQVDQQIVLLTAEREDLLKRIERLEIEVATLNRRT